MEINAKGTRVLKENKKAYENDDIRIVVNEGGTGSSKTYSLAQLMATLLFTEDGVRIVILRKSLPTLKRTAMRDFFTVLKKWELYDENKHNKTDKTYVEGNNMVEFLAADDPHKLRSKRQDIAWLNEANEFDSESYKQLAMRTEKKVFMDYNPSDEFHWIYDDVTPRGDCQVIKSTFHDNPFLSESIKSDVKRYKDLDENYWRIYGLGKRGRSGTKIITNWKLVDEMPDKNLEVAYGLDFGFNNPTAMTRVVFYDDNLYWDEVIYKRNLTTPDLLDLMDERDISKKTPIYPDPSEPEKIYQLRKAGYNIPMKKNGKPVTDNSVKDGIDYIKSRQLYVTKRSANLIKEIKSYSWKTKKDEVLDEPVKVKDHAIDSGRYSSFSHNKTPFIGFV